MCVVSTLQQILRKSGMAVNSGGSMEKARKRWGLGVALLLVAGTGIAVATPTVASAVPQSPRACGMPSRSGHIAGIIPAKATAGNCPASASRVTSNTHKVHIFSDPANGTPPLLFHGGPVMMTPSISPLVITPIFWNPTSFPMTAAYKSIITTYLSDVAAASGQNTNVFSTLNE